MSQRPYRSAFNLASFMSANKALIAGQYNKLGEYEVKAGETITLGYGPNGTMSDAVGRIYGAIMDTAAAPVELKGKIRLSIHSPQDRPLKIVDEFRTEALNTSSSDRTKQTPYPEHIEVVTEDKKIVLEFLPDAIGTGTLNYAASALLFDITQGVV
jgi:hypothetical protein